MSKEKTVFILKYQICWQCILQYCVFQPLLRLEENHVSLSADAEQHSPFNKESTDPWKAKDSS